MERKKLSEVLKVEEIIREENQRICIVSGVGSGKNYFVENELVKYGNILYISSRRAKVNEILENKACSDTITWDKDDDIVTMTNSGLERLVQNKKFEQKLDEIIEHFNYIVVDEAHSLFSDATYAESSFHVFAFIEYIIEKYPRIKVILMTGTPEPMESYLKKGYKVFDKTEECVEVLPKAIRIIDKKEAFEVISRMPHREKTVYYSNSAKGIVSGKKSLISRLEKIGFDKKEVGICMSESSIDKLKKNFDHLEDICKYTKEAILSTRNLPDTCRILMTTSSLKEGVNIENENVKVAFCESHILSEIQQFAGRLRKGLDVLYVINDARQHEINDDDIRRYYMEFHYAFYSGRNAANEYLKNEVMDEKAALYFEKEFYDRGLLDIAYLYQGEYSLATLGGSVIPLYIKIMQGSNPYLKFNHLTGKFDVFANRYIEQRRVNRILCGEKGFKWLSDIEKFTKTKGIEYIPSLATKLVSDEEIIEYCERHMGKIWVDDEKKNILDDLGYMMALSPKYKRDKVNKGFESFYIPYYIDELYTSRNGKNKRGIKIVER